MSWSGLDTWIVVVGALTAVACAVPGCFLVLRRMSMMSDAISHAVLPGIAAAFFMTGSRASLPMFLGAVAAGVLTAVLTEWIRSSGRTEEGAATGVVFTTLFALGLVMIVRAADRVDLDPGCVLYGAIEFTPLDVVPVFGLDVPRAALVLAAVVVLNALVVAVLFKELRLAAFDPELAGSMGFAPRLLHHVLMILTAITAVAAFESVGSILVVAMFVVPAAAARLLTDRLLPMLIVATAVGVLAAPLGHAGAILVPRWLGYEGSTSSAGSMAVAAGCLLTAAAILGPRHGLLARSLRRGALRRRLAEEDALAMLHRLGEGWRPRRPLPELVARESGLSRRIARTALRRLHRRGLVELRPDGPALTRSGADAAAALVRAHRLWESYLVEEVGLRADHVHQTASRLEHVTDRGLEAELLEELGDQREDPHGHAIPPPGDGAGQPLRDGTDAAPDVP